MSQPPASQIISSLSHRLFLSFFGLSLALLLFLPFAPAVSAQTPALQVISNSAKARYSVGLSFGLQARTTQGQINQAELRVSYGKNSKEEIINTSFAPGATIDARGEILLEKAPLAAGMPVSYYWALATDKGERARTETKTVTYEDTRFSWRQRTGPAVTVRWYNGDEDYGNLMYVLANDALATYKRRFSIAPTEQIYVSIYGSSREYFEASPDVPSWSGGYALAERNEILAIAPQNRLASTYIGEGIPHELSHVALFQHLGHKHAPRWLDEGFAVYNQNVIAPEYDEILKAAYRQSALTPLTNIAFRFPQEDNAAKLAYAQGRSIVTFLINNYGDAVWANLLDQLRYGTIDQAMQKVFGLNLAAVEEQWQNSLGGKKVTLPPALLKGPVSAIPPQSTLFPSSSNGNGSFDVVSGLVIGGLLAAVLFIFGLAFVIMRRARANNDPDKLYLKALREAGVSRVSQPVTAAQLMPTPNYSYQPPAPPIYNPPPAPVYNYQAVPPTTPPVYNNYTQPPASAPYYQPANNPVSANSEPDPFDIIAATFGPASRPPTNSNPYPYGAPPAADGGPDSPSPNYYSPVPRPPTAPDSDPTNFDRQRRP